MKQSTVPQVESRGEDWKMHSMIDQDKVQALNHIKIYYYIFNINYIRLFITYSAVMTIKSSCYD